MQRVRKRSKKTDASAIFLTLAGSLLHYPYLTLSLPMDGMRVPRPDLLHNDASVFGHVIAAGLVL
jgi:hypothetical protein